MIDQVSYLNKQDKIFDFSIGKSEREGRGRKGGWILVGKGQPVNQLITRIGLDGNVHEGKGVDQMYWVAWFVCILTINCTCSFHTHHHPIRQEGEY